MYIFESLLVSNCVEKKIKRRYKAFVKGVRKRKGRINITRFGKAFLERRYITPCFSFLQIPLLYV